LPLGDHLDDRDHNYLDNMIDDRDLGNHGDDALNLKVKM
jgi:hypothetical protein